MCGLCHRGGRDVVRVDVNADPARSDFRRSLDERGDVLRRPTGRVPRRLFGTAGIVLETDRQVRAIAGVHEQILLEARDPADDRHESGFDTLHEILHRGVAEELIATDDRVGGSASRWRRRLGDGLLKPGSIESGGCQ